MQKGKIILSAILAWGMVLGSVSPAFASYLQGDVLMFDGTSDQVKIDFNKGGSDIRDDGNLWLNTDDSIFMHASTSIVMWTNALEFWPNLSSPTIDFKKGDSKIYDDGDLFIKTDDNLYLWGTTVAKGTVRPDSDDTYDLGSSTKEWRNLYVDGTANIDVLSVGATTLAGTLDMNGQKIDLDADADTSITADTDDQVDLEVGGADEWVFTADQLDATNGQIVNIGAAGTDFSATGGLTLADALTVTAGGATVTAGGLTVDAGDGRFDEDLVVGGSTSTTETIDEAGFALGGDDLFVAGLAGIEGNTYIDGALDVDGATTLDGAVTLGDAAADVITVTGTLGGSSPLILEGATADDYEMTITLTEPTADRVITIPNETGTLVTTAGATFAGAVDMGNYLITNIGNAGTDFTTGGGLTLAADLIVTGGDITLGTTSIFSGGDTASLNNIDAIDATTETTLEAAIDALANLVTVGTIGTGVWQGTVVDVLYLDANAVMDNTAEAITAAWEIQDDTDFAFGNDGDFAFLYDETTDNRLEVVDADDNLMLHLTDAGTAGNVTITGNLTVSGTVSGTVNATGTTSESYTLDTDSAAGANDVDLFIYFEDDQDATAHYLAWDDGLSTFMLNDDLIFSAADTYNLGSTDAEVLALYIGDGAAGVTFGQGQDVSVTWDNTAAALELDGGLVSIGDDPTGTTAVGDNDLLVVGNLEVDTATDLDGALDVAGATTLNGTVTLGDAAGDTITLTGVLASTVTPNAADTLDLGTTAAEFRALYLGDGATALKFGIGQDATIGIDGTANALEVIADGTDVEFVSIGNSASEDHMTASDGDLLVADEFEVNGRTWFDGAVNLGDTTGDDITVTGYVASNVISKTADTYNFGDTTHEWGILYLGDNATALQFGLGQDATIGIDTTNDALEIIFDGADVDMVSIGAFADMGHLTASDGDLLVTGEMEVNGQSWFDAAVNITGTLTVTGNIVPGADNTYDLGTATAVWQDGFFTTLQAGTGDALTITANLGSTWSTSAGALLVSGDDGLTLTAANTAGITMNSTAGTWLVTATGQTMDMNGTTLDVDTTGAIQLDADLASNFNTAAGDITIDAEAGSIIIDGGEAITDAVVIRATGVAGGIDITSLEDIDITTTGAAGEDISVTNTGGSIILTATEAATDAIVLNASTALGGIDITSNEDIDITTTGAAGEDISVTNTGGSVIVTATESIADAIVINASGAAGGIDFQTGGGAYDFTGGGAFNYGVDGTAGIFTLYSDTAGESLVWNDTNGNLTLTSTTGAAADVFSIVHTASDTFSSDSLSIDVTDNTATGDVRGLVVSVNNAGAASPVTAVDIEANDTGTALAIGQRIIAAASATITTGLQILAGAGGAVTTAIDVSDAEVATALSFGANDIAGTNFTVTGASGNTLVSGTLDVRGTVSDGAGNLVLDDAVDVGADGAGHTAIFYSDTAGDNMTWTDTAGSVGLTITGTNATTAFNVADGNATFADTVTITGAAGSDVLTVTAGDVVLSDGSLTITDADNAATIAVTNNTASTIGAGAATGLVELASTSLTTGTLLHLELTEGTLAGGHYLKAYDVTGTATVFSVGEDGLTTIAGAADGTDALVLTAGDILVTNGDLDLSGGDFNVTLDAGDGANITTNAAAAADALTVTATAAGNDGLQVTYTLVNDADVDTVAAVDIGVTSANTADADVLVGLNIANMTGDANVLERAIVVGSGWDSDLRFADTSVQIQIADGGTFTFENATGTDFVTMAATIMTVTGDVVPEAAGTRALGGTAAEWAVLYLDDDTGLNLGLDQDAVLAYDETTDDRTELTGTGASLWIEDRLSLGKQALTITDDGTANDALTPTASYVEATVDATANAGTPNLTIVESSAKEGDLLIIINDTGSNDSFTINDEANVTNGSAQTLGVEDTSMFIYTGAIWLQISAGNN